MQESDRIELKVNGRETLLEVDPSTPLLYVLRNELGLSGPKYGCGLEQCGSCMALIDDEARPTCRLPVAAAAGSSITTIEGLASADGSLHPLQDAFVKEQAAQCGFCVNGMLISALALLRRESRPDRGAIKEGMNGALCRCGTHSRIVRAIESVAGKVEGSSQIET